MTTTTISSVDEYIESFPEEVQADLQSIRQAIKEAVPEAQEFVAWQMPGFRLKRAFVNYAAFKNHYSIFVKKASSVPTAFQEELAPYRVNKGTIQFRKSEPIPLELIGRMMEVASTEDLRGGSSARK